MNRDRLVQLLALVVLTLATIASGSLLPAINRQTEDHALRYTDVAVEGAPPFVAIGTMIGALRGLIVDYLWIKVNAMKERGQFYEVMADAELITKLQPRFAAVWAFHGHNMAYNISVATHTEAERWKWVKAGIHLVRDEGLRYNPNELILYRNLAFWFAHKIEGYSDDAHLFYKTEFCREWHLLLGRPPDDYQDRIAWIKVVADAPGTLEDAELRAPGTKALVDELSAALSPHWPGGKFKLDQSFLNMYTYWKALTGESTVARILGEQEEYRRRSPSYDAFEHVISAAEGTEQLNTLLAYVRKRVLLDEYNMDPQKMYEFTRDVGPIDWRHGQAHALYWTRLGSQLGEHRQQGQDNIYKVLNNDRQYIQSLQGLARSGRITFDPFSRELPVRMPDPRWIDPVIDTFKQLVVKHANTRGAGGDTFIGFFENFMSAELREWYRAGEREKALEIMALLDEYFGPGTVSNNPDYQLPLDVFVARKTMDEYARQPHLAPSEVAASLRYGFLVGVGRNRPEVLQQALQFARDVTEFYKNNETNDYFNKFGRGRMSELLVQLEDSVMAAFFNIIIDRSIPLEDRMTIWAQVDRVQPGLRGFVYDAAKDFIEQELANSPYGQEYTLDEVLPAPPNLEEARLQLAQLRRSRQEKLERLRARDAIEQRGLPGSSR